MSCHIRVSARALLVYENKILLNMFGGGKYYNLPGSGVEEMESSKE